MSSEQWDALLIRFYAITGFCRMDMAVVSEVVKQHDLWAYPYNALRNQALSRAATEVCPAPPQRQLSKDSTA